MPFSCRKVPKETHVHVYKDYSHADDASIIDHLEACLTNFDNGDVGVLWDRFKSTCQYCLDKFVPNKRNIVHKDTPWMTREIIQLKHKVKRLKKNLASPHVIAEVNGSLANALHHSKERYFSTTLPNFIKTDPTKFWNYLSEKKKPVSQINVNGVIINERKGIAEQFNAYFNSVFSVATDSIPAAPIDGTVVRSFSNFISYPGVLSMLLNLKTKTCSGPDNIRNFQMFLPAVLPNLLQSTL